MMGMGGANGPEADRRRRIVATVLVVALVLGVGATLFSLLLG
ncbi:hypothetical protein [Modestobacter sp. SYSU DS0290]